MGEIGLLFIDCERPQRIRLRGRAEPARDPALLGLYREAIFVVKFAVRAVFQNCPRNVHRYQRISPSRCVPRARCDTPLATWKRAEDIQVVVPERDAA